MSFGIISGTCDQELTALQEEARFYRNPSGFGSQGGYDCLFAHLPCVCPYPDFTDDEKKVWEWHWDCCNNFSQQKKDLICGNKSIKELGEVVLS